MHKFLNILLLIPAYKNIIKSIRKKYCYRNYLLTMNNNIFQYKKNPIKTYIVGEN